MNRRSGEPLHKRKHADGHDARREGEPENRCQIRSNTDDVSDFMHWRTLVESQTADARIYLIEGKSCRRCSTVATSYKADTVRWKESRTRTALARQLLILSATSDSSLGGRWNSVGPGQRSSAQYKLRTAARPEVAVGVDTFGASRSK